MAMRLIPRSVLVSQTWALAEGLSPRGTGPQQKGAATTSTAAERVIVKMAWTDGLSEFENEGAMDKGTTGRRPRSLRAGPTAVRRLHGGDSVGDEECWLGMLIVKGYPTRRRDDSPDEARIPSGPKNTGPTIQKSDFFE